MAPVRILLVLLFGLGWASFASSAQHALLIGIADYEGTSLSNLPGAANDLLIVKNVLVEKLGFDEANIDVIKDSEATHTGIADAFAKLRSRVKAGDSVYIHYSGHGSYTQDHNGDELNNQDDQTWVSFAARSGKYKGVDNFDVLDDEINHWLGELAAKANLVIYVSDSCHSATNTRGNTPALRAAPPLEGKHPLGEATYQSVSLDNVVRIAAARDDQTAGEFLHKSGSHYGLFTWHWVEEIDRARPGDSWRQVFERTRAGVFRRNGRTQTPQIAGRQADFGIAGGQQFEQHGIRVSEVYAGEQEIALASGAITGVTRGSIYGKAAGNVQVRITMVSATWSRAEILNGRVEAGDFLFELERSFVTQPLTVFILDTLDERSDDTADDAARGFVDSLGKGFAQVRTQPEADIVLSLRSPSPENGDLRPQPNPEAPDDEIVEMWVLAPNEQLLHEHLKAKLDDTADLQRLRRNLLRYRRVRDLHNVTTPRNESGIALGIISIRDCDQTDEGCLTLGERRIKRVPGSTPLSETRADQWQLGDLISFTIENQHWVDRYVYLYEVTSSGDIISLFPNRGAPSEARIPANESLDLFASAPRYGMEFSDAGNGSILVLTSKTEVDHHLLLQTGFESVPAIKRKSLSPLEQLLLDTATGATRGEKSFRADGWSLTHIPIRVGES